MMPHNRYVRAGTEMLADGAAMLRGFASPEAAEVLDVLRAITAAAPFRRMVTPGGHQMSVAMTNCGTVGWVSDRTGYRYDAVDPLTGNPWPSMPESFSTLASRAAAEAGFPGFMPDVCLINRYEPGTQLSLHQDKNERDFTKPIVSVSLGLPAVFLFGGLHRGDKALRIPLESGDVAVWGGPARLVYHGVEKLAYGPDLFAGYCRINLTFRKAL